MGRRLRPSDKEAWQDDLAGVNKRQTDILISESRIRQHDTGEGKRDIQVTTHMHMDACSHMLSLSNAPDRRYHYLELEMIVSSIVAESGAFHLLRATCMMSSSSVSLALVERSHQGELTACAGHL